MSTGSGFKSTKIILKAKKRKSSNYPYNVIGGEVFVWEGGWNAYDMGSLSNGEGNDS